MANMTEPQLTEAWAEFMRAIPNSENYSITKQDLKAAVNAVDQWVSDNASSYNNALPTAARNAMSVTEKARLLQYVTQKRYITGT
jgi:hypothetical protein